MKRSSCASWRPRAAPRRRPPTPPSSGRRRSKVLYSTPISPAESSNHCAKLATPPVCGGSGATSPMSCFSFIRSDYVRGVSSRRERARWYLDRARAMSAAELAWRIQSTATLPARALVRRRPALPSWERPEWNAAARALVEPYSAAVRPAAERIAAGELRFWGHRVDIELTATDWTNVSRDGPAAWRQDPKAVWELHRLQHVLPLAAAAAIDEREEWARLAAAHL